MTFSLHDEMKGWTLAAPFLFLVVVLLAVIRKTAKRIETMDSFAAEFKKADAKLGSTRSGKQSAHSEVKILRAFPFYATCH